MRVQRLAYLFNLVFLFLNLLFLGVNYHNNTFYHDDFEYVMFEAKYVVCFDNHTCLEFVGDIWINGAIDYNNRPFFFKKGECVCFTAPETVTINNTKFKFAFWQREKEPLSITFQDIIITNRTLCIRLKDERNIWWANYYLLEES